MSSASDRPFSESEKLYLLAEILKDAAIPASTLMRIIRQSQIEPRWTEISLPHGRSVSACQKTYADLVSRSSDLLVQSLVAETSEQTSAGSRKKKKRPLPTGEASTSAAARTIQPRPAVFAPVNGQDDPTTQAATTGESDERPRKKRGRPSKAEQEIRAAQAAERGEIYPPPKKVKTPRPSMEGGAPVAVMTTPLTTEDLSPGTTSTDKKKRRGRPNKQQLEVSKLSLEATAHAVEQMQAEAGEVPEQSVPETQAPEYTSPYHTLAEMQAYADREDIRMMEPETAESSYTMQQLSGPPLD